MSTLLPALRSGSFLRPFLGDIITELNDFNWPTPSWAGERSSFRMDVAEYKDRYIIKADLAGIRNDEVEITLNNSRLTIEVKPQAEVQDGSDEVAHYIVRERFVGATTRTILLPFATSEKNVDALLKDGMLTITIKKDESLMPKKITIH